MKENLKIALFLIITIFVLLFLPLLLSKLFIIWANFIFTDFISSNNIGCIIVSYLAVWFGAVFVSIDSEVI